MHVIDEKLQSLECPLMSFTPLVAGLVGRTRLTQFLKGSVQLDSNTVDRLIAVLDEMNELKNASLVAPDWSDEVGIREQLTQRRAFKEAVKYDTDDIRRLMETDERS
jgi:hypothetical protein